MCPGGTGGTSLGGDYLVERNELEQREGERGRVTVSPLPYPEREGGKSRSSLHLLLSQRRGKPSRLDLRISIEKHFLKNPSNITEYFLLLVLFVVFLVKNCVFTFHDKVNRSVI